MLSSDSPPLLTLNIATCSPSTSAATPALGTMSSSGQTRTAMASRNFKISFPLLRPRRTDLLALGDEHDVAVRLVAVHEMAEALQDLRRLDRLFPFAGVAVDELLHVGFEFGADSQRVLAYGSAHVVDAALQVLQPG